MRADPKEVPSPPAGVIISREDTETLLDLIWVDRKNWLRALSAMPLPGFTCIICLLWRHVAFEGTFRSGPHIAHIRNPVSPLLDILARYWLVVPSNEETVFHRLNNEILKLPGAAQPEDPGLIDVDDSTTLAQALENRIARARQQISEHPTTEPSSDGTSPQIIDICLQYVLWHLRLAVGYPFISTYKSAIAYIYDMMSRLLRTVQPDSNQDQDAQIVLGLRTMFPPLISIIVFNLKQITDPLILRFFREVIAEELLGLMSILVLRGPFSQIWGNQYVGELLRDTESFLRHTKLATPGYIYNFAFPALFPAWMRTRLQLAASETNYDRKQFLVCWDFWNRVGKLLHGDDRAWNVLARPETCTYSRCPGTPVGAPAMFACSICENLYCSATCQASDWTQSIGQTPHSESCRIFGIPSSGGALQLVPRST